jgi:hypothetical protein
LGLDLDQLSGDVKITRRGLAIEEYRDLDREREWKRGGDTEVGIQERDTE